MPGAGPGNSSFGEFDVGSMDGASLTAGAHSRQKRVMPSRSRRGGPGLGHCEVDNLILETKRRKCVFYIFRTCLLLTISSNL